MTAVYLGYGQAELDALLDVRRRVTDWENYTERFGQRSVRARGQHRAVLDVAYGSHPRERLDVFLPPSSDALVPAQIFFHGGYWRSSDKERYSYLADAFVPAGAACVVVEYALVPTVDMDELIRQCRAALAYVHDQAAEHGIDSTRLYVSGHSAGGQIVGMLMASGWQPQFGLPADVVKGGCGISGLYDMAAIRHSYLNETLRMDDAAAQRLSPSLLAPASAAPLILAVGALEGDEFLRQNALMDDAWEDRVPVTPLVLNDGNHYTAVEDLGDPTSELGHAVLVQMRLA